MTKTKAIVVASLFATFTGAQAVQADDKAEQTAKLCADIANTQSAIDNFKNLSKDSTVEEAKRAQERVSKAIDDLGDSAKKPRPQQYKELKTARQEFRD